MARFKNTGRKVTIYRELGKPPVSVGADKSVSTDDEDLKSAFRKAGFKEAASPEKKEKK